MIMAGIAIGINLTGLVITVSGYIKTRDHEYITGSMFFLAMLCLEIAVGVAG